MWLIKNVVNFFSPISYPMIIDEVVHHHYHKPNRKVFLNGELIKSDNTGDLSKKEFQRVMMFQKNIICL